VDVAETVDDEEVVNSEVELVDVAAVIEVVRGAVGVLSELTYVATNV
jgi:hypothetical protein